MSKKKIAAVVLGLLMAGGCASSYLKVTDPSTNKSYYTQALNRQSNGAVTFTNARDGNVVTLQNSTVEKINQQQFETGKNTPAK